MSSRKSSKPSMKLELKKFDPKTIDADSVVVMIGKRNSGKSVCIKDILSYHKNLPIGTVISPTEIGSGFFGKFIPNLLLHDEYSPELLEKFVSRQKKLCAQINIDKKKTGSTNIDPRAFLILDDCLYDSSWMVDKNIRTCFMNGRHFKIFFLLSLQFSLGISPIFRCQTDYIFIFNDAIIKNKQRLYEHYCGFFETFDIFRQVMDQICVDYGCLVINNKTQSNKIEDKIFWYKAEMKDFKMCSDELWDLQALEDEKRERCYHDPNTEEDYNPNIISKSGNKINLNIIKK
jgi:hypothetical protein